MTENQEFDSQFENSTLLQGLGIKPTFSEEQGPPVNREALKRYLDKELVGEEAKTVALNVARFRNWFSACRELLHEKRLK